MTLGQNEAVPLRPLRVGGIDAHFIEVERRQSVQAGQRSARMAGSSPMNRLHCKQARPVGHEGQVFAVQFFHGILPLL